MVDKQAALQILYKLGVFMEKGHFRYSPVHPVKHGTVYVNTNKLFSRCWETAHLCRAIARRFKFDKVQAVIARSDGVALAQWVTHNFLQMDHHQEVSAVCADKEVLTIPHPEGLGRVCYAETGDFIITRDNYSLVEGKNVLMLEDVIDTGTTARTAVEAARAAGGNVVGVSAICNRNGVTHETLNVPKFYPVVDIQLKSWDAKDCPLCDRNIPINTEVGHGRRLAA